MCNQKQQSLGQILKPRYNSLPLVSVWILQEAEANLELEV